MIPLRDDIATERTPYVAYALLAINVLLFLWQWMQGGTAGEYVVEAGGLVHRLTGFEETIWRYGVRPVELTSPSVELAPVTPGSEWLTPLSSMFLHGGWLHLIGNMLYLWIFADNVEDALGPVRFVFFYLVCGLVGVAAQVAIDPDSAVPMVGASGAIAGVLGGYLLLYPRARVLTALPILFFIHLIEVPAVLFLGVWILLQLVNAPAGGGTAWFAHIGGFVAGLALAKLLAVHHRPRRPARA